MSTLRQRLAAHPVATYLAVTFAVTWGAWLPMALAHRGVTIGFSARYQLGLLGPLLGALVATALTGGGAGLRRLGAQMVRRKAPWRAWAVVFAPVVVLLLASAPALVTGGGGPSLGDLGRFNGFPVTSAPVLLLLLILVNGFGEETGWRGFLLPALERRHGPLAASLLLALVWLGWHVPAFWVTETYRQMSAAMVPGFVIGVVCGSVFLAWLYHLSGGSILVVAVWHGVFNATTGTVATRGTIAAIESAVVMAAALVLVTLELRALRREHRGRPGRHVMLAGTR